MANEIGPIHPGEFLADMMEEMGITAYALAKAIDKPQIQVSRILHGKSGITAHMARLLGGALGITPEMLLNWQGKYDLEIESHKNPDLKIAPLVQVR